MKFYFRRLSGAVNELHAVVAFEHLVCALPGKRVVNDFVGGRHGIWELDRLPSYAPELNPVKYFWGLSNAGF